MQNCRHRIHGSDTPFSDWLRRQQMLPSRSSEIGFVATDNDLTLHVYKTPVDNQGVREIQLMMHLEVKTRNGAVRSSQLDTLWKLHHLFIRKGNTGKPGQMKLNGCLLWHFGVSILTFDGTSPDDSREIKWMRFSGKPERRPHVEIIQKETLIELLRFDLHPDSLEKKPFRRRHCTREIYVEEKVPLGFVIEKPVILRS